MVAWPQVALARGTSNCEMRCIVHVLCSLPSALHTWMCAANGEAQVQRQWVRCADSGEQLTHVLLGYNHS